MIDDISLVVSLGRMEQSRISCIFFGEYFCANFYQIGVEDSCIIFREYRSNLTCIDPIDLSIDFVDFSDHLHDGILDPVMDHLHIVT